MAIERCRRPPSAKGTGRGESTLGGGGLGQGSHRFLESGAAIEGCRISPSAKGTGRGREHERGVSPPPPLSLGGLGSSPTKNL